MSIYTKPIPCVLYTNTINWGQLHMYFVNMCTYMYMRTRFIKNIYRLSFFKINIKIKSKLEYLINTKFYSCHIPVAFWCLLLKCHQTDIINPQNITVKLNKFWHQFRHKCEALPNDSEYVQFAGPPHINCHRVE